MSRRTFRSYEQVCGELSISRTTLWRLIRAKKFPAPAAISPGRKGFDDEELEAWKQARLSERAAA